MSEAPYSPAEPPADGDRTSQVPPPPGGLPRFSASASVPVPPANPSPAYGNPSNPFGQGPPYGQGAPFSQEGTLGQPPSYQGQGPSSQGQGPSSGQTRASASVPAPATQPNPPPYGSPPQGYPAQAGTYGGPGGPASQQGQQGPQQGQQYGSPPGGTGQFGSAPAPSGQSQFGSPPTGQGQYGSGQGNSGYGPAPGAPPPAPGGSQQGYGGATYDRQTMPAMGQGTYSSPVYGQPAGDPGRPRDGQGQGPGGWTETEQSGPPPRKSRRGLIIGLIAAAVLVVVSVGGYVGWSLTNRGSAFTVGACVKQDGSDGVITDCSTAGAYRIANIVDTENGCPDANQPSLLLTERVGGGRKWACLVPAS